MSAKSLVAYTAKRNRIGIRLNVMASTRKLNDHPVQNNNNSKVNYQFLRHSIHSDHQVSLHNYSVWCAINSLIGCSEKILFSIIGGRFESTQTTSSWNGLWSQIAAKLARCSAKSISSKSAFILLASPGNSFIPRWWWQKILAQRSFITCSECSARRISLNIHDVPC